MSSYTHRNCISPSYGAPISHAASAQASSENSPHATNCQAMKAES